MLEKLVIYPTFGDRFVMLQKDNIDFNKFEEENIPPVTNRSGFENALVNVLSNEKFAKEKHILKILQQ